LKQRSTSPKQIDALASSAGSTVENHNDHASSPSLSPHPELAKRSLFVAGLRNSIKQAEGEVSDSFAPPTDLLIKNSNPSSSSHPRPRSQTTIIAASPSSSKPSSSHRATVRGGSVLTKSERSSVEKADWGPLIKPISPRIPTGSPRSLTLTSPKRSPTGSEGGDDDSAGDSPRDENMTYALFSIVEARSPLSPPSLS
jgi:hypothetical protein